jgi:hypothetical protein
MDNCCRRRNWDKAIEGSGLGKASTIGLLLACSSKMRSSALALALVIAVAGSIFIWPLAKQQKQLDGRGSAERGKADPASMQLPRAAEVSKKGIQALGRGKRASLALPKWETPAAALKAAATNEIDVNFLRGNKKAACWKTFPHLSICFLKEFVG